MPSLNRKDLQGIFRQWEIFSIFIETGTNEGITAFEMAPCFKEVHTVEICETLHAKALEKSKNLGFDNVTFHLGDSTDVLPQLLPSIEDHAIFFLDGHWSSDDTGKGKKDCPLIEELQSINELHKFASLIIIDDFRLFGTHFNEDWSAITVDAVRSCFPKEKIFHDGVVRDSSDPIKDRYCILLNSSNHDENS